MKKYDLDAPFFLGNKGKYSPEEEVEIYYPFIATDTDYTIIVDGRIFPHQYEEGKGFVVRFAMPDHDVKVEIFSRNSMVCEERV